MKITTTLVMIAIISAAVVVGIMGISTQVAHAQNPHSSDPDDITKTNPQGKSVGNPHNLDEGIHSGNPHLNNN